MEAELGVNRGGDRDSGHAHVTHLKGAISVCHGTTCVAGYACARLQNLLCRVPVIDTTEGTKLRTSRTSPKQSLLGDQVPTDPTRT
eukprot:128511-Rhodomonas_salina.1